MSPCVQKIRSARLVVRRSANYENAYIGYVFLYFYGLERRVAVYGLLLVVTGPLVRDGGPGWFSLLVIAGFWNMIRDWQRTQRAELPTVGTDGLETSVLSLRRHEQRRLVSD